MTKTNTEAQPSVDGAFLRAMQEYRKGETLTELADALREVTEACGDSGKTGSLTLKLIVRPTGGGAFQFQSEISIKAPKAPSPVGIFYADDQNNLVRHDPNQEELKLRTVEPEQPVELRKAVAQ